MYLHPSHLLISILLSATQGLFSSKQVDPKLEIWSSKCERLLAESNMSYSYPPEVPARLQRAFERAVKKGLIELTDVKAKILDEFPPENHEYILLGNNHVVLTALFELDAKTRNRSLHLPLTLVRYGEDFTNEEQKRIFSQILEKLKFRHDETKQIVVIGYASDNGFEVENLSALLRDQDDPIWHEVTFALIGKRFPKSVEMKSKYSFFKISAALDSLLYHNYFAVLEPMYEMNLSYWNLALAGEAPFLLPAPVFQKFLDITREEFPDAL